MPPPNKFSTELWEEPRQQTGLKLIGELSQPGQGWKYVLNDESRRSFAAFLGCPFTKEQTKVFFDQAKENTDWKQPEGPKGPIPRKTAWMVAKGCECTYRFGQIEVPPQEYPPWMLSVMSLVMPLCGLSDPS